MNTPYKKPVWPAPAKVHAYVTTRTGGHSVGKYASFNLAEHVNDKREDVEKNRAQLMQALSLPSLPVWLNQIHSNKVINAAMAEENSAADAAFTFEPNIVCVVKSADCLPILLCDEAGRRVAAIHAGWRGLSAGVIENTVQHFRCARKQILAWLGPAIGPDVYEVGDDVRDAFMAFSPLSANAFKPLGHQYLANIYLLARQRLETLGITQIFGGDACTFTQVLMVVFIK